MQAESVEWKPIKGYEGSYEVSSDGQIRSVERIRHGKGFSTRIIPSVVLTQQQDRLGYKRVGLRSPGRKKKYMLVHRVVATAFIPAVEGKVFINHKNGVKNHNPVENLEWCTTTENAIHAKKTGLMTSIGEGCYMSKLTENEVHDIVAMSRAGEIYKDIASKFRIRLSTVGEIMRGASWSEVTGIQEAKTPKLTDETVHKIVELMNAGSTTKDVGKKLGVCAATIGLIMRGDRRSDLTGIKRKSKVIDPNCGS